MTHRRRVPLAVAALAISWITCVPAWAARVPISWSDPVSNTNGTALTDLANLIVQWGTCAAHGTFGAALGAVSVKPGVQHAVINSAAAPSLCAQVFAVNSKGKMSDPSDVVVIQAAAPGQPIVLPAPGQPVTLPAAPSAPPPTH